METSNANPVAPLLGHLYRRKAGQLVATLVRIFGPDHIDLAETVVQDAFLKACEHWPYHGVPPNPVGWLTTVAKNRALNLIRREKRFAGKEQAIRAWYAAGKDDGAVPARSDLEEAAALDDQLRLMFICCHPCLPERDQVCLTLKTVGGFSVPEIARAFLSTEGATRKRITRAKQKIRHENVPFAFPEPHDLPDRLDSVLRVLYLIFNEGYSATAGQQLGRAHLCDEAIWLTSLFLHEAFAHFPKLPTIKALLALMLLQSSRIPARTDAQGNLLVLAEQDRALWDAERIALGLTYLGQSATGDDVSGYHLEAEIAAHHAGAPSYEAADWSRILACYDALLDLQPSPVVALNRVVALSMAVGPEAGLRDLDALAEDPVLHSYYLLPATYAALYRRLHDLPAALRHYRQAHALAPTATEKRYLAQRIADCTA